MRDDLWLDRLRRAASVHEADAERERQHMERHRKSMERSLQARDECLDAVASVMEARELANG